MNNSTEASTQDSRIVNLVSAPNYNRASRLLSRYKASDISEDCKHELQVAFDKHFEVDII